MISPAKAPVDIGGKIVGFLFSVYDEGGRLFLFMVDCSLTVTKNSKNSARIASYARITAILELLLVHLAKALLIDDFAGELFACATIRASANNAKCAFAEDILAELVGANRVDFRSHGL